LEFNKYSNSFKYGLAVNSVITQSEDYDKLYRFSTPQQFVKQGGGVCWDWVTFEADYFKRNFPNVRYDAYYIQFVNKNGNCPSHTFLTFNLGSSIYYFESAFGKCRGVYKANTISDIINFVMDNMSNPSDEYFVVRYNALSSRLNGTTCAGFMNYMNTLPEINHVYNPHYRTPVKL
jgi:hypothetical protein